MKKLLFFLFCLFISSPAFALNYQYKYNAFTGRQDIVVSDDSVSVPGGSDTQVQYNDAGAFAGDAGLTYNKTTNQLAVDEIDLTGGNITTVPIGGDIDTYITAATAGDTLILAAGTYTVTSTITVNKKLHIKGQGKGITTVTTATESLNGVFTLSADGAILSDMTISNTCATTTARAVYVLTDSITVYLRNLNLITNGSTATHQTVYLGKCSAELENVTITATQGAGSSSIAAGLYATVTAATITAQTLTLRNCSFTVTGNSSTYSAAIMLYDNGSSVGIAYSGYNNYFRGANSGAGGGRGSYMLGANCVVNSYGEVYSGLTYDMTQGTSAVITLYDSILVNNTTSGTFLSSGNRRGGGVYVGNSAAPGNKGITWSGGTQFYEQLSGGGGTDRTILQANGDRFDTLNEAGGAYLSIVNGTGLSLGTGAVPTAKLDVKATADDQVLKLTAYSSQTANIVEVFASDGTTNRFKVDADGDVTAARTITSGGSSAGQSTIASGLVVNDASGATTADQFRVESDSEDAILLVSDDAVKIGDGNGTKYVSIDSNAVMSFQGGADIELPAGSVKSEALATEPSYRTIGISIDGGGSAITTGAKGYTVVPYACTITQSTALLDTTGNLTVDFLKDTYANFPPEGDDTICASAYTTIAADIKSQDSTLVGWTTAVASGDTIGVYVITASGATKATVQLRCEL